MTTRVLVGEGDSDLRATMCRYLRGRGYHVHSTSDGQRALRMFKRDEFEVAVVDLKMPGLDSPRMLSMNSDRSSPRPIIAVTPESDIYQAVAALRGGVFEYLTKPFEMHHVEWLISRASTSPTPLEIETRILYDGPEEEETSRPLFGFSRAMQQVFRAISKASYSKAPVLLVGDEGTGKEMVARVLHHASPRRNRPFVSFHPGTYTPEETLELIFGNGGDEPGLLEEAEGGTLFIDEVWRLGTEAQEKLLRVLKRGRSDPDNGGLHLADVRLVASSRIPLTRRVQDGAMRSDFYWFLRSLTIRVPALRERREDILPLARWILTFRAQSTGTPRRILEPETLHWLRNYHWPGNVRELESVLVRGMTLADGMVISRDDLVGPSKRLDEGVEGAPAEAFEDMLLNRLRPVVRAFAPGPDGSELYKLVKESSERAVIMLAMERSRGNQSKASRLLGINRNTLRTKIDELQIPTSRFRKSEP